MLENDNVQEANKLVIAEIISDLVNGCDYSSKVSFVHCMYNSNNIINVKVCEDVWMYVVYTFATLSRRNY